jgi:hypothetical protein
VALALAALAGCGDNSTGLSTELRNASQCVEAENPYGDDGGHDAGYKWAEETGGECSANSQSFNEGCENYHAQSSRYEQCMSRGKK